MLCGIHSTCSVNDKDKCTLAVPMRKEQKGLTEDIVEMAHQDGTDWMRAVSRRQGQR